MKDYDIAGDDAFQDLIDELDAFADEDRDVIDAALTELAAPAGAMTIREALNSDDPLDNIRAEIHMCSDEQILFAHVYAGLTEVNSAGVSILWDRFPFEQADLLMKHLREIKAPKTLTALQALRDFITERLGQKPDEDAVFDLVGSEEFEAAARPYDVQYRGYVEEMEHRLLEYARAHVAALEQAPESR